MSERKKRATLKRAQSRIIEDFLLSKKESIESGKFAMNDIINACGRIVPEFDGLNYGHIKVCLNTVGVKYVRPLGARDGGYDTKKGRVLLACVKQIVQICKALNVRPIHPDLLAFTSESDKQNGAAS